MGFETQEEAERFAEHVDMERRRISEERLINRQLNAWFKLIELPAYKDISPETRALLRTVFDYAWTAALKPHREAAMVADCLTEALNPRMTKGCCEETPCQWGSHECERKKPRT